MIEVTEIHGYSIVVPAKSLQHPELAEAHREALVMMLDQRIEQAGRIRSGDITWLPPWPFSYEETGEVWQDEDGETVPDLAMVERPLGDADFVRLTCEAPTTTTTEAQS